MRLFLGACGDIAYATGMTTYLSFKRGHRRQSVSFPTALVLVLCTSSAMAEDREAPATLEEPPAVEAGQPISDVMSPEQQLDALPPLRELERPAAASLSQIATQGRRIHERLDVLQDLKAASTADLQIQVAREMGRMLGARGTPMADKQRLQLEKQLQGLEVQAARLRGQLEAGVVEDPAARRVMERESRDRQTELNEQMSQVSLPFDTASRATHVQAQRLNAAYQERLEPIFFQPDQGPFKADSLRVLSRLQSGYVSASWRQENRTLASASIRIRERDPNDAGGQAGELLDDRWPIDQLTDRTGSIRVGDFTVTLTLANAELRSRENISEALTTLIDLDALSRIDADAGQAELARILRSVTQVRAEG